MTISLEVFLDHTCPFSYMAYAAAMRVAEDRALAIRWRTLPIAGANGSLTPAEAAMHVLRRDADWPRIEALAATSFGLKLERPEWGADARQAASAAHWAERESPDQIAAIHGRLFRAHFEGGRDIGDPDVLAGLLRPFGLDTATLGPALASGAFDDDLEADARAAEAHGVTAVPAIVADGYLLIGAHPSAVLDRTIEQVMLAGSVERPSGGSTG